MGKSKAAPKQAANKKSETKKIYIGQSHAMHRKFAAQAVHEPNFSYVIVAEGCSISLIDINSSIGDNSKKTAKLYADRGLPFYVEVRSELVSPDGHGSFQLTDLKSGKNVFTEAQEFVFNASGRGGIFLKNVSLP